YRLHTQYTTATHITNLEDDDWIFRTVASDATQGIVGAQLARGEIVEDNVFETASIFYLNNPYGQGLAEAFEAAFTARGGTVLASVSHRGAPQPRYAAGLETLLEGDPDVILAVSYPGQATVYMSEARDLYDFTSCQYVDGPQSLEVVEAVGAERLEGQFGTGPGADPEWSGAIAFQEAYEENFGSLPNLPFIDTAHDAVAVLGLAAAWAHVNGLEPTPENIRDGLRAVNTPGGRNVSIDEYGEAIEALLNGQDIDYTGATGTVDFDKAGDVS